MRIGLDATAMVHGERAVRRNTRNLYAALVEHEEHEWALLCFNRAPTPPLIPSVRDKSHVSEYASRWPMRLLIPLWKYLGMGSAEHWLGAIDLLYAPDLYFPPTRQAPVLCTIRGLAYKAVPEMCAPEHVRSLNRAFAYARRHADYFLAVSETTKRDMLRLTDIPEDRIFVVSHGVDPAFRELPAATCRRFVKRRFNLDGPFMLYVGVIARHKNVQLLVEAMAKTAGRKQALCLVLAGPYQEPFTTRLRQRIADLGLQDRIILTGPLDQSNDELLHLYNAATALVFPSFYEGWCAPPLEAMACGTPVIASDVPAVAEVVDEAGVLLPVDDVDAWTQAMQHMCADAEWRRHWCKAGTAHVQRHTWAKSAARMIRVMERVAAQAAER